jgi:hypothetical protein
MTTHARKSPSAYGAASGSAIGDISRDKVSDGLTRFKRSPRA